MQFSSAGFRLLKQSEGFAGHVYKDAAGLPTIGYGHKLRPNESFPSGITMAQGENLLAGDVTSAECAVERLVRVPLTQGQFDALVDFVFNLGSGRLAGSTLLKLLNAGQYDPAAKQLLLWDHGGAGEKELPGLKARREAEFNLWSAEVTA